MKWSGAENTLTAILKFLFSTTCQNKLYLPPSTSPPAKNKMRTVTFQIMSELHSTRVYPEIACNQSSNGRSVCTPLFFFEPFKVQADEHTGIKTKDVHFACFIRDLKCCMKTTISPVVQKDSWHTETAYQSQLQTHPKV